MNILSLEIDGRLYRADAGAAHDISIPLRFGQPQPQAFGAPPAQAEVYKVGNFIGDVRQGGSCNCQRYHLTPHCNGTHTESVAHITGEAVAVNELVHSSLLLAQLITVEPVATDNAPAGDRIVTLASLRKHLSADSLQGAGALIARTTPNSRDKLTRNYDVDGPAYFEPEALAWLAELRIDHLLVDLPSVDRMDDGGHLLAHRAFWGLPAGSTQARQARRRQATITELIFVPDAIADGRYLLSLQLAPFATDATPSRPLLYALL